MLLRARQEANAKTWTRFRARTSGLARVPSRQGTMLKGRVALVTGVPQLPGMADCCRPVQL